VTARLYGGSDLKARLTSVANVPPDFAKVWADETAKTMRATAPNARRAESHVFTTRVLRLKAAVYGAFWWIFVDRGTKAHDIFGSGGKNPPDTLMFSEGGNTIFAKKVHHPRTRRNPFISRAAQNALTGSPWVDTVVKHWNRQSTGSHQAFL
jgi:hypothetical protein